MINSRNIFNNLMSRELVLNQSIARIVSKENKLLATKLMMDKNLSPQLFFQTGFQQGLKQGIDQGFQQGIQRALGVEPRAEGGPVTKGEPYLVGEKGPEIFEPNMSGNIVPNENISIIPNDINPNSINQSVNSSNVRTVIQPIIQTQIQQVSQPVPMSSSSVEVVRVDKSQLPTSIAKMIN
tara:strand:- start:742 stop:1284 length:543 start_codon:yes stop_codon:yes gene_type:complete